MPAEKKISEKNKKLYINITKNQKREKPSFCALRKPRLLFYTSPEGDLAMCVHKIHRYVFLVNVLHAQGQTLDSRGRDIFKNQLMIKRS